MVEEFESTNNGGGDLVRESFRLDFLRESQRNSQSELVRKYEEEQKLQSSLRDLVVDEKQNEKEMKRRGAPKHPNAEEVAGVAVVGEDEDLIKAIARQSREETAISPEEMDSLSAQEQPRHGAFMGAPGSNLQRAAKVRYSRIGAPAMGRIDTSAHLSRAILLEEETEEKNELQKQFGDIEAQPKKCLNASADPLNASADSLAVARPVAGDSVYFLPIAEQADQVEENISPAGARTKSFATCVVLLVAALLVGIAFLVSFLVLSKESIDDSMGSQASVAPTGAPTMLTPELWVQRMLPAESRDATEETDSPQAKALRWIAEDPNLMSYSEPRIIQRFALAVFFIATGGEDWILKKDWLSYEVNECSWYHRNFLSGEEDFFLHEGVTEVKSELELIDSVCDSDGRYLHLIFTDNNMHGTLPPELSLLSDSLLDLEVGSNENLGGVFPSEIGLLSNLRKFYANRNQHTGPIPTELGMLRQLEKMELGYNSFTGSLPTELGNMEALSFLSVRFNDQLTGTMPTELYRLTNMVSLYINGLDLITSAKLLPEIGQMTKLENIKTYPLPFNSSIPTEIGLLTNMLRLNFWKSHITGSLPSELFLLTNMMRLDVDDNALTGTVATEFGRFSNLTMAWMNGNRFSGTLPASILESWGKFTLFKINNNNMTGKLPTEIGLLKSIEQLWLSHNEFTGHIPSELGRLNNLTELFLHDTKIDGNIPETLEEMAALEHFTVSNTSLTGSIPNGLCDRVWDMIYTCNEYHGGAYTLCYDAERVNFTCSSTNLCGCDACGEC